MVANSEINKKFTNLPLRANATVSHFTNDLIGSKLIAMGVLPGSQLTLVRKAPFGGSWYVKADNFYIALRKTEVESIVLA